jgi:group I intron endonuclease
MATAFLGYLEIAQNKIDITYICMSTILYDNINNNSQTLNHFIKDKKLKPAACFEDLGSIKTKNAVNRYSKEKSGVYCILNKITMDFYIGSASTNKIYSRYYKHLISFEGSKIVKLAIKKYKLENFAFIILELFPKTVNQETNKMLLDLEDFYLKSLLPNYNILTEAGNTFGYKHTEISRINMISVYTEERRNFIFYLNKGRNISPSTLEKKREKALLRAPRKFTEEALANMKKMSKALMLLNKDGTVFGQYNSILDASKAANCSPKSIQRANKTESKLLKKR